MSNICKGSDIDRRTREVVKCTRESEVADLCRKHYAQEQRGRLGKTVTIAAPGENEQVVFRVNGKIKASVEKYAATRGKGFRAADVWREAIAEYLAHRGFAVEVLKP